MNCKICANEMDSYNIFHKQCKIRWLGGKENTNCQAGYPMLSNSVPKFPIFSIINGIFLTFPFPFKVKKGDVRDLLTFQ